MRLVKTFLIHSFVKSQRVLLLGMGRNLCKEQEGALGECEYD